MGVRPIQTNPKVVATGRRKGRSSMSCRSQMMVDSEAHVSPTLKDMVAKEVLITVSVNLFFYFLFFNSIYIYIYELYFYIITMALNG